MQSNAVDTNVTVIQRMKQSIRQGPFVSLMQMCKNKTSQSEGDHLVFK